MEIKNINLEKKEIAGELHGQGYSCAQCVLMAYAPECCISGETAARIGAGLGAGVSCGEICGVASAMAVVAGLRGSDSGPMSKKAAMAETRRLLDSFSKSFGGKVACRDLKGKCGVSCNELIERGVELLSL